MSYLVLDLLFLLPVAVVGFLFRRLLLREAAAVPYGSSRFDYPEYYWYRRMPVVILLAMTLVFDNIMIGNHARLDHRLVFNLFRRRAFYAQVEVNSAAARELVVLFNPPLADRGRHSHDRPSAHRGLPSPD